MTKQSDMKRYTIMTALFIVVATGLQAQKIRTYTANEQDSMACITALSLYIEFFKQDNYTDAIKGWRTAAAVCPKSTESLWINGIKMYSEMIEKEKDEAKKNKLVDTLIWAYDQRIAHFGKEGYVLGRKGSDMLKYRPGEPEAAHRELMKSLELQGNEMEPGALIYLYKSAYDLYRKKSVEKTLLFDLYEKAGEVVEHNMAGNLKSAYVQAQENIDKMFGTVAECPDLIEIYSPKLTANPNDEQLLRQIIKVFEKRDCTDADVYQLAAVNLYKIEPSATAAYAIANGYAKKDNYSEALSYYSKAVEQAGDDAELKAKALNKSANTALLLKQFPKAKSLAQQLLAMNPNDGEAYIIIGDAYMGGRKDCGDNECTSRAAFWAAADKYARAKQVDPNVAETANKRLATAQEQFPKKEDCFFHSINEGDSYTLDCWIGETTTVRTRSN